MRKKVMAANWKMYKTPDETRDYFRDFLPLVAGHDRDEIVVCPPYTDVAPLSKRPRVPTSPSVCRMSTGRLTEPTRARSPRPCCCVWA